MGSREPSRAARAYTRPPVHDMHSADTVPDHERGASAERHNVPGASRVLVPLFRKDRLALGAGAWGIALLRMEPRMPCLP